MTFLKPTEVDKAARRVESVQIIASLLLPVFFLIIVFPGNNRLSGKFFFLFSPNSIYGVENRLPIKAYYVGS